MVSNLKLCLQLFKSIRCSAGLLLLFKVAKEFGKPRPVELRQSFRRQWWGFMADEHVTGYHGYRRDARRRRVAWPGTAHQAGAVDGEVPGYLGKIYFTNVVSFKATFKMA